MKINLQPVRELNDLKSYCEIVQQVCEFNRGCNKETMKECYLENVSLQQRMNYRQLKKMHETFDNRDKSSFRIQADRELGKLRSIGVETPQDVTRYFENNVELNIFEELK